MHDRLGHPGRRGRRIAGVLVALSLATAVGCGSEGGNEDSSTATTTADSSGGDGSADTSTATTADTTGDDGSADTSTVPTADTTETTATASTGPASPEDLLGPIDAAVGEPLRVGFIGDGQSPAGDNRIETDMAQVTAEYLNERKAGIGGRPIELVICETQNDPARGTDCANQMVEEGVPFVGVGSTGVYDSVSLPLREAGIPTIFVAAAGDELLSDPVSTFSFASSTVSNFGFPIAVAEKEGVDKVTVVVIDVPPAWAAFDGPSAQLYADAGLEVELVRVPIGTADMTPSLSPVISGDPGLIHIIGNDTFCIAALQAMEALGYDGPITAISFCFSDATTQAFPNGYLEGINSVLAFPDGEADSSALYRAVVDEYASMDIDLSRSSGVSVFALFAGLDAALDKLEGDVTAESVIATLKSMPEMDLPGGGGIRFSCDGMQEPTFPAVCTNDGLYTVLDAQGQPTTVELISS